MVTERAVTNPSAASDTSTASAVVSAGAIAGIIGASTIALWFLILDTASGRPLYTPSVLGTALFRGGIDLATRPVSLEMVLVFTWAHVLHFLLIGVAASYLLSMAERHANLGFGIVLLFVVFEFGFVVASMLFAEPVLQALAWPAVLVGNLLAAAAMGLTLWRWHPGLRILP